MGPRACRLVVVPAEEVVVVGNDGHTVLREVEQVDDLASAHFAGEHRHLVRHGFPCVDADVGAGRPDARPLRPGVAKQVLVGREEVVVARHPVLQLAVPPHAVVGEVLPAEHVVAAKFEMRAAEGEHHGVGHDDARRVEVLAVARVVHVGGKDGAQRGE